MMDSFISRTIPQDSGILLGQLRPTDTNDTTIYEPDEGVYSNILTMVVCNTTNAARTFRIHHNETGATLDATMALYYDHALAANATEVINLNIFMNDEDSYVSVRADAADAITFSLYGKETRTRAR